MTLGSREFEVLSDRRLSRRDTAEELRALCEHASVYVGLPRALKALAGTDQVLAGAGHHPAVPVRQLQLGDHTTEVAEINGVNAVDRSTATAEPVVVLIHALGLTWRMWEPVMHAIAHRRPVLAYDIRGHGAAADAPPPAHMDTLADDLHRLLEVERRASAHVVGLSYGGAIAQGFAVNHPDAVESLTLVAVAWRAFLKLDTVGRLSELRTPTLVLAGESDASTTPQVMRPIAEAMPDARYVEMAGAPHMPTLETPQLVVEALDSFLPRSPS